MKKKDMSFDEYEVRTLRFAKFMGLTWLSLALMLIIMDYVF